MQLNKAFDEEIQINKATINDIQQIAKIHKESFSKIHTLTFFSIGVIGKYYNEFLNEPDIIFLVLKKNKETIGFILGGESRALQKAQVNFKRYNFNRIGLECFKNLYNIEFTKKILTSFINLIKNKFKEKCYAENDDIVPYKSIRLLSIAVNDCYQGKGMGSLLLKSFEAQLDQCGISKYGLTVRKQNISAIKFYRKMGFKVYKESKIALYYWKALQ